MATAINLAGTTDADRPKAPKARAVSPCFTPGTVIATERGERLVEDLSIDDGIVTRDNGIQKIRWIGARWISGRDLAATPHLFPILIKAGAFGDGLPEQDMSLSPNHRVLVNNEQTALYFEDREVLVAAKHLVNNRGVFRVHSLGVAYIHIMFERHEVVLSNGSWSESFQAADYSLRGIGNAQRQEILEIFPDVAPGLGGERFRPARRVLTQAEARQLMK
ncbi:MAG: Hint domain-containing protein [Rhodobacter sp.]|nr:Hint domain-containing protein [Rhodobacter sp.]